MTRWNKAKKAVLGLAGLSAMALSTLPSQAQSTQQVQQDCEACDERIEQLHIQRGSHAVQPFTVRNVANGDTTNAYQLTIPKNREADFGLTNDNNALQMMLVLDEESGQFVTLPAAGDTYFIPSQPGDRLQGLEKTTFDGQEAYKLQAPTLDGLTYEDGTQQNAFVRGIALNDCESSQVGLLYGPDLTPVLNQQSQIDELALTVSELSRKLHEDRKETKPQPEPKPEPEVTYKEAPEQLPEPSSSSTSVSVGVGAPDMRGNINAQFGYNRVEVPVYRTSVQGNAQVLHDSDRFFANITGSYESGEQVDRYDEVRRAKKHPYINQAITTDVETVRADAQVALKVLRNFSVGAQGHYLSHRHEDQAGSLINTAQQTAYAGPTVGLHAEGVNISGGPVWASYDRQHLMTGGSQAELDGSGFAGNAHVQKPLSEKAQLELAGRFAKINFDGDYSLERTSADASARINYSLSDRLDVGGSVTFNRNTNVRPEQTYTTKIWTPGAHLRLKLN